jgi:hypothetical protein
MYNYYKLIQLFKNLFEIVSWSQNDIFKFYKLTHLSKNPS